MHSEHFVEPSCDTCGAPITTGAMAAFCPRREQCEFYPPDAESQAFLAEMRAGFNKEFA